MFLVVFVYFTVCVPRIRKDFVIFTQPRRMPIFSRLLFQRLFLDVNPISVFRHYCTPPIFRRKN